MVRKRAPRQPVYASELHISPEALLYLQGERGAVALGYAGISENLSPVWGWQWVGGEWINNRYEEFESAAPKVTACGYASSGPGLGSFRPTISVVNRHRLIWRPTLSPKNRAPKGCLHCQACWDAIQEGKKPVIITPEMKTLMLAEGLRDLLPKEPK